ncbi:FecCD family ABC transporter permease [Alkaliphilus peptidifermentans]|uniref:Iron complex transport system permease protein n=1 Tax=Alkaliphilus peptidifermentans DSM 18978 TaxID=1120976 RepID=A0A1G5K250_9FIRM|nr:iron chelate uptake ABC transporter family permease subunit [Alkaliphilus peptidifermentans]SCY94683.1 iron complex transport system permease protein [Alkaliphilus peptidifermentans DSM 18978]
MKKELKFANQIVLLLLLLFLVIAVASVIGAANISIFNSIKIIFSQIPILGKNIDTSGIPQPHVAIITNIRLPRIFLAFLVGYGLSIVGVALQGLLKNPMADPYITGTSSGAALGAAIAIMLKLNRVIWGFGIVSIFAFFGALLATLIVYNLAKVKSKVPVTTLLLAGIATGQFFTAIMSFIMVISSKDVTSIVFWTMGSFSSRGWNHVQVAFLPIIIGSIIIYVFAKDLNVLLLGESTAQNTGVNVEWVKRVILITSALLTAFAVSVSGIIGFVGLIIPHVMRMLVGPDHRILIPASGLMGGIFLIAADTVARTVIAPTEIPVGIITALAGGPFFIYLLRKTKKVI